MLSHGDFSIRLYRTHSGWEQPVQVQVMVEIVTE